MKSDETLVSQRSQVNAKTIEIIGDGMFNRPWDMVSACVTLAFVGITMALRRWHCKCPVVA
eukprot:scaffold535382_cov13-Prasinocladus_malaysianus.AAC.1